MNTNNINSDKINDFTEPRAWVDARLSQLCLQEPENQDEDPEYQEDDEEDSDADQYNDETFSGMELCYLPDDLLNRVPEAVEEEECEYDEVLLARKRQKLFDVNIQGQEDIPMDISDDEYNEPDDICWLSESDDEGTELDEQLVSRQLFAEEYDMLSVMSDIEVEEANMCKHGIDSETDVCKECCLLLDEENHSSRPMQRETTSWIHNGTVVYNGNPNGSRLFDDDDDEDDDNDNDNDNDNDDDDDDISAELALGLPSMQRETTNWEHNGVRVYNGNPNGFRLFDEEEDDEDEDEDMPELIAMEVINEEEDFDEEEDAYHSELCELEVKFGDGQYVSCEEDAERVYQLRKWIAEYESKIKK